VSKYVKFTHERAGAEIAPFDQLPALNECRRKLHELYLIGVDSNGIGFGNLSARDGATSNFYITGSATRQSRRVDACGLGTGRGIRLRTELGSIRGRSDSFV
jgi:hypothetical protein